MAGDEDDKGCRQEKIAAWKRGGVHGQVHLPVG